MRAAVANGADAVYFGLQEFNARHRAANFALADLPRLMGYLHDHNVRGFLAFNILIFSEELPGALATLRAAADAGVDAILVQDVGLALLVRDALPQVEVHASTQMTLTEPRGIEMARKLGVKRVVLARELSLADIQRIRGGTDMPLEVFVHGALCVSYSGQCLTSEALGGRSANRGQCAQACRLPYDLVVDGDTRELGDVAYLLSPQDLAAHDLIADLLDAGVCSFKIEGRLKTPHYVAATCQTYRSALDAAAAGRDWQIDVQATLDLAQSFSRGFEPGFLLGVNHQRLVDGTYSKKRGLRLGTVTAVSPRGITYRHEHEQATLKNGDGVVFATGADQNDEVGGRVVQVQARGSSVQIALHDFRHDAVPVGAVVWKTDDPAVRKRLEQSYARDVVKRPALVNFEVDATVGQALRVTVRDARGRVASAQSNQTLEQARKHPTSVEDMRQQLDRLGDTPFALGEVTLRVNGQKSAASPAMVPRSLLNDLRRQAVESLQRQQASSTPAADPAPHLASVRDAIAQRHPSMPDPVGASLHVLVRDEDQLAAALRWRGPVHGGRVGWVYAEFEDVKRYREAVAAARDAGVPIALATTRIVKPGEDGLLRQIAACEPDAVLVRTLGAIHLFAAEFPAIPLLGDYALNIANEVSADYFLGLGLRRWTPSYDLSWPQLQAMWRHLPPTCCEVVVHQHMPMFHTEHCVFAHTLSQGADYRTCGRPCDQHEVSLSDRVGVPHPLMADVGCRNTVYNGTAQTGAQYIPGMLERGVRHFRVEVLRDTPDEVTSLLDRYGRVIAGLETPRDSIRSLRVLHQLGVTRGTFE
jgi:putative protease